MGVFANIFLLKPSLFGAQMLKSLYKVQPIHKLKFMDVYTYRLAYILYFLFHVSATLYGKILRV